jgi:hypothetical protein
VEDRKAPRSQSTENLPNRLDARPGERYIVAEKIDIAAFAAKIGLHVDDDQRRVVAMQRTVEGPRVGVGRDVNHGKRSSLIVPPPSCKGGIAKAVSS